MSSERDMRKRVVRALRSLDAVSIENGVGVGTPDVNFAGGWLELKAIDDWPAHPETPVRVDHFRQEQKIWLTRRSLAGEFAGLLLKVGGDWLLFDGAAAAIYVGRLTQADLRRIALRAWDGGLNETDFCKLVTECSRAIKTR